MLKVGIIGATGYTGEELVKILLKHSQVRITYLAAKVEKKELYSKIFPYFKGKLDLDCDNLDIEKAIELCDLLFLALPHTVSMQVAPHLLTAGKKVIDLSADYRFKNISEYKTYYKEKHTDINNLKITVYGLPELYREEIKKANLIANPGCYPTLAILALAPIISAFTNKIDSIIIDAKSGLTGAGRKASMETFFSEINENLKAYKVNNHQHMPEIENILSKIASKKIKVNFVPHLVPLNRGILETICVNINPKSKVETLKILDLYKKFYKTEKFVRIYAQDSFPAIKDVLGTNFCDIGLKVFDHNLLIIIACLDNLLKGAAGQAVQNMNIMYGFKETEALL